VAIITAGVVCEVWLSWVSGMLFSGEQHTALHICDQHYPSHKPYTLWACRLHAHRVYGLCRLAAWHVDVATRRWQHNVLVFGDVAPCMSSAMWAKVTLC